MAGQCLADVGAVPADELDGPEGRAQPVAHGIPVPDHSRDGADQPESEEDQAPAQQGPGILGHDPGVDGPAHGCGQQCLAHHPDDAEGDGHEEREPLGAADPPRRRTGLRRSGVPGWG